MWCVKVLSFFLYFFNLKCQVKSVMLIVYIYYIMCIQNSYMSVYSMVKLAEIILGVRAILLLVQNKVVDLTRMLNFLLFIGTSEKTSILDTT